MAEKMHKWILETLITLLYSACEDGNVIKYKWELIVTHTGRRTCATNMYLSKKYTTREMMLVTGHKKEENFMKYIKLGLDEEAHKLAMLSDGEMF